MDSVDVATHLGMLPREEQLIIAQERHERVVNFGVRQSSAVVQCKQNVSPAFDDMVLCQDAQAAPAGFHQESVLAKPSGGVALTENRQRLSRIPQLVG